MRAVRRLVLALAAASLVSACGQGHANARHGGTAAASAVNGSATGKFTAAEYVIGDPKAKVQVIEYLSDTCSHCARFDAEVFPAIKAKYIDTGKVGWHIREFLTDPVQISAAGFVLARCAGRDKYLPVIEAIFHSQEELFKTGDVRTIFTRIAQSMGMSEAQMNTCLQDDAALKAVADRVQKAQDVDHISGTPTFLFNGHMLNTGEVLAGSPYNGGELPFAQFEAAYAKAAGKHG